MVGKYPKCGGLLSKQNVNPVWGTPDAMEQAESLVTMWTFLVGNRFYVEGDTDYIQMQNSGRSFTNI